MHGYPARTHDVVGSQRTTILAGAVCLALCGAALYNHRNARRSEDRNPPLGAFVRIGGSRVHYVDRGRGNPIVLLHGNGGMAGDYEASGVTKALSRTHRVIAFDRPGFGYTPRPRSRLWTPVAQADLTAKLMRRLGVERALVVGHSWGTLPAIALALNHPGMVAGLVLGSGVYHPGLRQDVLMSFPSAVPGPGDVLCHTVTPLVASLAGAMQTKNMFAPAPVADHFSKFPMGLSLRPSQMRTQSNETVMLPAVTRSLSRRYRELDLPVTIVTGTGDRIADPSGQAGRLHREIRGSRLVELPGVGHMVHYTALPDLLAAIESTSERAWTNVAR